MSELNIQSVKDFVGVENDSILLVTCLCFHHVPGPERGSFMDELYRILKPGGTAKLQMPWYRSARAYQDFMAQWPPLTEASFFYFKKAWREENVPKTPEYDLKCDFEATFAYATPTHWTMRHEDAKAFAAQHYWDVATDLHVALIKRSES